MPRVFEEGSEEYQYIMGAIKSGQVGAEQLERVLIISKLTGKSVTEVNSAMMDAKVGVRQVYQDYLNLIIQQKYD